MLLEQFIYIGIMIFIGNILLFLRRKSGGSKAFYKIILILTGIVLGFLTLSNHKIINLQNIFINQAVIVLLIIILFELSSRLNSGNVQLTPDLVKQFFTLLLANFVIIGILAAYLLNINYINALFFAVIISSIEYFMIDDLKIEGDFSNPILILIAFSLLSFFSMQSMINASIIEFIRYLLIGLGTGLVIGIILFRTIKNRKFNWLHEIGLVCAAVFTYIITNEIGGSGMLAVMVMGFAYGNSHVKYNNNLNSFSPFIYKSAEILAFMLLGLISIKYVNLENFIYAICIYLAYTIIRFAVLSYYYKHYSIWNKIILTTAPKGMVYAILTLVLATAYPMDSDIIGIMINTLFISLLIIEIVEYFEAKKMKRLDKMYYLWSRLKYGRRRTLDKINLFKIFRTKHK